jgi:hypothetical protein
MKVFASNKVYALRTTDDSYKQNVYYASEINAGFLFVMIVTMTVMIVGLEHKRSWTL